MDGSSSSGSPSVAQVLCTILHKEAGNANFEVRAEKWEDDFSNM